jgi:MOSC domain-containing protein YiiM
MFHERDGNHIANFRLRIFDCFITENQRQTIVNQKSKIGNPTVCITPESQIRVLIMNGRIFQLNSSPGGVPKLPLREAMVAESGLVGDGHNFPDIHGGPDRALCLFSLERILELQSEGHPIFPGSVGENVTVSGIDWIEVEPGKQMALGDEVVIEITRYTSPCNSITSSFYDGNFARISQKVHPGYSRVYARVLRSGRIVIGQSVRLL